MSEVRKTFLSQIIGCENPRPGISVFHKTFFVSLHSVGRFFSSETPCASGPRHCGQLDELNALLEEVRSVDSNAIINKSAAIEAKVLFMNRFSPLQT